MRPWIGVRRVGGAAAAELGVDLDDVANVDHQQERRPALMGGQRAGLRLGLGAGAQQRFIEAASRCAGANLLGFEHEGVAPVAVDPPFAAAAVAARQRDAALEHLGVVAGVFARGVWRL
jgi:hypothetical protein